jgi:hypothetical protein
MNKLKPGQMLRKQLLFLSVFYERVLISSTTKGNQTETKRKANQSIRPFSPMQCQLPFLSSFFSFFFSKEISEGPRGACDWRGPRK